MHQQEAERRGSRATVILLLAAIVVAAALVLAALLLDVVSQESVTVSDATYAKTLSVRLLVVIGTNEVRQAGQENAGGQQKAHRHGPLQSSERCGATITS